MSGSGTIILWRNHLPGIIPKPVSRKLTSTALMGLLKAPKIGEGLHISQWRLLIVVDPQIGWNWLETQKITEIHTPIIEQVKNTVPWLGFLQEVEPSTEHPNWGFLDKLLARRTRLSRNVAGNAELNGSWKGKSSNYMVESASDVWLPEDSTYSIPIVIQ